MSLVVGLGPWILYWILDSNDTHEEAAVAALVASVVILVWGLTQSRNVKILEVGSVLWFAVLSVMSLTAEAKFFADWAYMLSNAALAVIVLISILAGRPFARQYARDTVPEEYWNSDLFLQSTLVISWAWFVAFAVMAASSALTVEYPEEEMWFNWIIPIGVLVATFKFTEWYPDYLRRQHGLPARVHG